MTLDEMIMKMGQLSLDNEALQSRVAELERERDAWQADCAQGHRNTDFYRGLVAQIGEMFGKEAYISDDGSIQQDVLAFKSQEDFRAGTSSKV